MEKINVSFKKKRDWVSALLHTFVNGNQEDIQSIGY